MTKVLESLLGVVGIERTEKFFSDFQKAREAMERLSDNDIHPLDGDVKDQLRYGLIKQWAKAHLRNFNSKKSKITLLTSSGKWCYVPYEVREMGEHAEKKDKFYSQFYWDIKNNQAVHVY